MDRWLILASVAGAGLAGIVCCVVLLRYLWRESERRIEQEAQQRSLRGRHRRGQ